VTITEIAPEANLPQTRPSFSLDGGSCRAPFVWYENKQLHGIMHPCRRISCPECGEVKRNAEHKAASYVFSSEQQVFITYVREIDSEKIRKHLKRLDLPGWRVPVGKHWVALFTAAPLDTWNPRGCDKLPSQASRPATEEEIRSVFLVHRVPKRHVRRWGRWEKRVSAKPARQKAADYEVIARKGVSLNALRTLGQDLGERVFEDREGARFNDSAGRGANWYKNALRYQEEMLRERRMYELGHPNRYRQMLPYGST
jgi:hypothetical protein